VKSSLLNASSILLSDGFFVFVTNTAGFLSGTLSSSGTVDLAILYSTAIEDDSQDFSWLNRTVLHLGNVSGFADGGWLLRLLSSGIKRSLFDQFIPIRSLVLSVPGEAFYSISCERDGRLGLLTGPDAPPGFWVNSSRLFVPDASVVWMESQTPLATESLALMQSAKLSPSAVDGSDVLESAALLASSNPPASQALAPDSSTFGCSARSTQSGLPASDGLPNSGLPASDGFPRERSDSRSGQATESTLRENERPSGSSATIGAVVGSCVAGIALCAGVAAFGVAIGRRRARAHARTAGSPAGVEVDPVDEVEDGEDAVSFANPLDSIDVFAGTV
jgi:hypothetical protein